MIPNKPSNVPGQAGYMPYFYESGRFLVYPLPSRNVPGQASYHTPASYDFSSDRAPVRHLGGIQTVEQVIEKGYFAVPQGDPVTAIIADKKHTSRFGLDDVIRQIRGRYELFDQNMQELEESVCAAHNSVFRQEADQGTPANQRQQYSADKRIQEIYEQQRAERVNLWRDVSRLRLALPENAQQYLTAHRKVSALESHRGDGP